MAESKTYVFGNDANNGMISMLAPLLQRQGLDPNMVMAMIMTMMMRKMMMSMVLVIDIIVVRKEDMEGINL